MKNTKILAALALTLSLGVAVTTMPTNILSVKACDGTVEENIEEGIVKNGDEIIAIKDGAENLSSVKRTNKSNNVTDYLQSQFGSEKVTYVKDQVLLRADDGVSFNEVKDIVKENGGIIVGYIQILNQYQVEFSNSSTKELQEKMDKLKGEEKLESDSIVLNLAFEITNDDEKATKYKLPNDPWGGVVNWNEKNPAGNEWGLEAVSAPSAWQFSEDMNNVNVGVIEVGNFYDSEDLRFAKEPYKNSEEAFDVGEKSKYHANHVAGIIGAISDNGKGVTGVACNATLYGYTHTTESALEIMDELTTLITKDYVKVINYSAGYKESWLTGGGMGSIRYTVNQVIGKGLKDLLENGYDFVISASSGNYRSSDSTIVSAGLNSAFTLIGGDENKDYNCVKDRIIVVGSVGLNGDYEPGVEGKDSRYKVADSTQLGKRVDIVAPGVDIYSTLNDNNYKQSSGTSMASPHVAGVASMVWGLFSDLTGKEVKDYIVNGASESVKCVEKRLRADDYKEDYPMLNAASVIKKIINSNAYMDLEGWYIFSGDYYYLHNGDFLKGLREILGDKYYFNDEGAMQTGWQQIDNETYYFEENGKAAVGWRTIDGEGYYFNSEGVLSV